MIASSNKINFSIYGLDIDSDNIWCKWSTRKSSPTIAIRQCMCGSYREQTTSPTSRVSAVRYPYVGCLAFIMISYHNGDICGAAGYLEHLEQYKASKPQRDPLYRLLPCVRKNT